MAIVRSFIKYRPCIIFEEDILKYGWERAFIIGNLPQCIKGDGSLPEKEELYHFFKKIFTKERFYYELDYLVYEGELIEEEVESE